MTFEQFDEDREEKAPFKSLDFTPFTPSAQFEPSKDFGTKDFGTKDFRTTSSDLNSQTSATSYASKDFGQKEFGPKDYGQKDFDPKAFAVNDAGSKEYGAYAPKENLREYASQYFAKDYASKDFGAKEFGVKNTGTNEYEARAEKKRDDELHRDDNRIAFGGVSPSDNALAASIKLSDAAYVPPRLNRSATDETANLVTSLTDGSKKSGGETKKTDSVINEKSVAAEVVKDAPVVGSGYAKEVSATGKDIVGVAKEVSGSGKEVSGKELTTVRETRPEWSADLAPGKLFEKPFENKVVASPVPEKLQKEPSVLHLDQEQPKQIATTREIVPASEPSKGKVTEFVNKEAAPVNYKEAAPVNNKEVAPVNYKEQALVNYKEPTSANYKEPVQIKEPLQSIEPMKGKILDVPNKEPLVTYKEPVQSIEPMKGKILEAPNKEPLVTYKEPLQSIEQIKAKVQEVPVKEPVQTTHKDAVQVYEPMKGKVAEVPNKDSQYIEPSKGKSEIADKVVEPVRTKQDAFGSVVEAQTTKPAEFTNKQPIQNFEPSVNKLNQYGEPNKLVADTDPNKFDQKAEAKPVSISEASKSIPNGEPAKLVQTSEASTQANNYPSKGGVGEQAMNRVELSKGKEAIGQAAEITQFKQIMADGGDKKISPGTTCATSDNALNRITAKEAVDFAKTSSAKQDFAKPVELKPSEATIYKQNDFQKGEPISAKGLLPVDGVKQNAVVDAKQNVIVDTKFGASKAEAVSGKFDVNRVETGISKLEVAKEPVNTSARLAAVPEPQINRLKDSQFTGINKVLEPVDRTSNQNFSKGTSVSPQVTQLANEGAKGGVTVPLKNGSQSLEQASNIRDAKSGTGVVPEDKFIATKGGGEFANQDAFKKNNRDVATASSTNEFAKEDFGLESIKPINSQPVETKARTINEAQNQKLEPSTRLAQFDQQAVRSDQRTGDTVRAMERNLDGPKIATSDSNIKNITSQNAKVINDGGFKDQTAPGAAGFKPIQEQAGKGSAAFSKTAEVDRIVSQVGKPTDAEVAAKVKAALSEKPNTSEPNKNVVSQDFAKSLEQVAKDSGKRGEVPTSETRQLETKPSVVEGKANGVDAADKILAAKTGGEVGQKAAEQQQRVNAEQIRGDAASQKLAGEQAKGEPSSKPGTLSKEAEPSKLNGAAKEPEPNTRLNVPAKEVGPSKIGDQIKGTEPASKIGEQAKGTETASKIGDQIKPTVPAANKPIEQIKGTEPSTKLGEQLKNPPDQKPAIAQQDQKLAGEQAQRSAAAPADKVSSEQMQKNNVAQNQRLNQVEPAKGSADQGQKPAQDQTQKPGNAASTQRNAIDQTQAQKLDAIASQKIDFIGKSVDGNGKLFDGKSIDRTRVLDSRVSEIINANRRKADAAQADVTGTAKRQLEPASKQLDPGSKQLQAGSQQPGTKQIEFGIKQAGTKQLDLDLKQPGSKQLEADAKHPGSKQFDIGSKQLDAASKQSVSKQLEAALKQIGQTSKQAEQSSKQQLEQGTKQQLEQNSKHVEPGSKQLDPAARASEHASPRSRAFTTAKFGEVDVTAKLGELKGTALDAKLSDINAGKLGQGRANADGRTMGDALQGFGGRFNSDGKWISTTTVPVGRGDSNRYMTGLELALVLSIAGIAKYSGGDHRGYRMEGKIWSITNRHGETLIYVDGRKNPFKVSRTLEAGQGNNVKTDAASAIGKTIATAIKPFQIGSTLKGDTANGTKAENGNPKVDGNGKQVKGQTFVVINGQEFGKSAKMSTLTMSGVERLGTPSVTDSFAGRNASQQGPITLDAIGKFAQLNVRQAATAADFYSQNRSRYPGGFELAMVMAAAGLTRGTTLDAVLNRPLDSTSGPADRSKWLSSSNHSSTPTGRGVFDGVAAFGPTPAPQDQSNRNNTNPFGDRYQDFLNRIDSYTKKYSQDAVMGRGTFAPINFIANNLDELEEEADEALDKPLEEEAAPNSNGNVETVLRRPMWMIAPGETLDGIAETHYGNADLGWLIADLNMHVIRQTYIDGKRVVELRSRQQIELPVKEDIEKFYKSRAKEHCADNLITVVVERSIDREVVEQSIGKVIGAKDSSTASSISNSGLQLA